MDEIFRKKLKVDNSVPDAPVPDEPDDYTLVPDQNKGETCQRSICEVTPCLFYSCFCKIRSKRRTGDSYSIMTGNSQPDYPKVTKSDYKHH